MFNFKAAAKQICSKGTIANSIALGFTAGSLYYLSDIYDLLGFNEKPNGIHAILGGTGVVLGSLAYDSIVAGIKGRRKSKDPKKFDDFGPK